MRSLKAVEVLIPPDKSISHRAVILASISKGTTRIKNVLMGEDTLHTIEVFRAMGVEIASVASLPRNDRKHVIASEAKQSLDIVVYGVGMHGLRKPLKPLYLGNSGTTMRILPGILAGQDFDVTLTGDKSLSGRPMRRIVEPLKKMGVEIASVASLPRNDRRRVIASEAKQSNEIYPPLKIHGGKLKAIKYNSKVASAQVKSCILLAGLYADGVTSVTEPEKSRDHTERMLAMFRCRVKGVGCRVSVDGPVELKSPGVVEIPGDISSAAFFIAAGCILPDVKIVIKNAGLNPTRTGIIDILKRMGAEIDIVSCMSLRAKRSNLKKRDCFVPPPLVARLAMTNYAYEPYGDIIVKSSQLKGVAISGQEVINAIDEIPVIMVAACFAKGKTVIKGIEELRVKETDRVHSMVTNLRKLGADIIPLTLPSPQRGEGKGEGKECIIISGGKLLHGARVSSFGDHRTAMSMLVAGLGTRGRVIVTGLECINKSFPNFISLLRILNQS